MFNWWNGLSTLNQAFYVGAVFFSTIFAWQFISTFGGLSGDGDVGADADADVDIDLGEPDLVEDVAGMATFRMLSIRSILAFGTLFSWAGALYLQQDIDPFLALVFAVLWGLLGMAVVAAFFWILPRLTEVGTASLDTAVGQTGQVYMDIPVDGTGQIRVLVSGTVSFVKARSTSARRLLAGTMVRVVRRIDSATLEVEEVDS